jgi:hypothetical protein
LAKNLLETKGRTVRKPVLATVSGSVAFNKVEISRSHYNLMAVFQMHKFGHNLTFSVDECGFSCE